MPSDINSIISATLMMKAPLALSMVFVLIGCCVGLDIIGGSSIDESDNGILVRLDSSNPIPMDLSSPASRYRDPSQYNSPPFKPKPKPPTPPNNDTSGEIIELDSKTYGLTLTSNVKGAGSHTRWISIGEVSGIKAKDVSSAKNGSLDLVNILIFSNILTDSNTTTGILASRSLTFLGNSYREREDYSNGNGSIRDNVESGAIRKNTTYYASFNNLTTNQEEIAEEEWRLLQRRSAYTLDTRFAGSYTFDAQIPGKNASGISEFYVGRMAIKNTITSLENCSYRSSEAEYLPCCMPPSSNI